MNSSPETLIRVTACLTATGLQVTLVEWRCEVKPNTIYAYHDYCTRRVKTADIGVAEVNGHNPMSQVSAATWCWPDDVAKAEELVISKIGARVASLLEAATSLGITFNNRATSTKRTYRTRTD